MPRESAISVEVAVNVLKKYITFFIPDTLPQWSSPVWKQIADDLDLKDKWTVESVRTNVTKDRRKILTLAREQCGIFLPKNKPESSCNFNLNTSSNNYDDNDDDDDGEDDDDNDNDPDYVVNSNFEELSDLEEFDVEVTRQLWNEMLRQKPSIIKGRERFGLEPRVWTDIIAHAFWQQYRLKCAFVFKKGAIRENGIHYMTMRGRCKDSKCSNPFFGFIENPPGENGSIYVKVHCRDLGIQDMQIFSDLYKVSSEKK
ncbi:120.7 kDa protein in NOF-FB transposable element [Microplitis demolitor]|uniref:120.7 kDa protein in NOF-FB transposable element n=1 Tax=Microplitis demolitor TaxID=69319 RepID=UPI00235B64C9|nr:120.7 kDa protein in NOF-FB transposable element [Microplitis demolitor]